VTYCRRNVQVLPPISTRTATSSFAMQRMVFNQWTFRFQPNAGSLRRGERAGFGFDPASCTPYEAGIGKGVLAWQWCGISPH
jgi:hypothetical protein